MSNNFNSPIKTAIFPVAGLGTRFLPVTKAGPKEMLPIVDKPLIQYVVEEAIQVGITQLVFVTSGSKRAIEDYFDSNVELESTLEQRGKLEALSTVKNILPPNVNVVYTRQSNPLGLGDAVLRAKNIVGNNPFAVLLADDIMELSHRSCLQQMVETYQQTGSSVLAVEEVPREHTDKYGIVSLKSNPEITNEIASIIEKPKPKDAPSTLAVTGRYVLTPRIFELLEQTGQGFGGEIQLTDAIAKLLKTEKVSVCPIKGKRYDCGTRQGFLQATVDFALRRDDLREEFAAYLEGLFVQSER